MWLDLEKYRMLLQTPADVTKGSVLQGLDNTFKVFQDTGWEDGWYSWTDPFSWERISELIYWSSVLQVFPMVLKQWK